MLSRRAGLSATAGLSCLYIIFVVRLLKNLECQIVCFGITVSRRLCLVTKPNYARVSGCLPDSPKLGFRVRVRVSVSANRD